MNCSKIKKNTKWKPLFKFKDALRLTIQWYKNNSLWLTNLSNQYGIKKELELIKKNNKLKNIFFTVIDKNYILRAYALFKSMQPFLKQDKFFIVCLDIESFNFLERVKKKENLNPIHLEKKKLRIVKKIWKNRPYNEFCWTMKSISFEFFSENFNCDWMIYLDSDSMVFSSISNYLNDSYDLILTPQIEQPLF